MSMMAGLILVYSIVELKTIRAIDAGNIFVWDISPLLAQFVRMRSVQSVCKRQIANIVMKNSAMYVRVISSNAKSANCYSVMILKVKTLAVWPVHVSALREYCVMIAPE